MKTNPFEQTIKEERTTSVFIHLSSFARYIIPFGGLITPLIIWSFNRDKPFVDEQGRQAVNFQLSLLLYKFVLLIVGIPLFFFLLKDLTELSDAIESSFFSVFSISASFTFLIGILILFSALTVFEIIAVIVAATRASRGVVFHYPLSIPFIRKQIQDNF